MTAETAQASVFALDAGGLRMLLKRNRASEVVAVRLWFRGGAQNLDPRSAGAEMLYARTARRGTERYPKAQLNATLSRLGIDLNAAAGNDSTVFNLRCLRRHLPEAWDLFADVVLDPRLEAAELDLVRQQMLLEIRQTFDNPDGALGEMARRHCFVGHPYAANPHGTEESVPQLDAAVLRAHVARHFTRRNALLVVSGNVEPEMLQGLAKQLERLPLGDSPATLPPRLHFATGARVIEGRDLPTNYILGEFVAPALRDPEHPATLVAMSVLRDRFFEEVRTKRNLSYAPSASLGHDAANTGGIYVTAADPSTTLEVMRAEMRRLYDEPLPAKELADKVRTFVTRYALQNETNHAQAGFLASYELFGGGWERSNDVVARLEALTPDDIARVAKTTLRNIQYLYLGDPDRADPAQLADP
jgi:zinc protease